MTVKQLIKELKKIPSNLQVCFGDHDHSTFEINNFVNSVDLIDKKFSTPIDRESEMYNSLPEKFVKLRP